MEEIIRVIMTIISIVIQIILLFAIIRFCIKKYKEENDTGYKFLYLTTIICWLLLALIYNFDRYNLPSWMGWTTNIDTQDWLTFLGSYLPGIISTIVSAIMLLWVTAIQIKTNREDNEKRDFSCSLRFFRCGKRHYHEKTDE